MTRWGGTMYPIITEGTYATATGTYDGVPKGHAAVAAISHTGGGALNTALANDADDITAPATGDWNDLVSITGGPLLVQFNEISTGSTSGLNFAVDNDEDANDAVRVQILVDDVAIFDVTLVREAAADCTADLREFGSSTTGAGSSSPPIFCLTSFKIRATRQGTLAQAGTHFYTSAIWYNYVTIFPS